MNKKYITAKRFDDLRIYDEAREDVLYIIKQPNRSNVYAWSDDGVGFHFYGTYKEFQDAGWG